MHDCDFQLNNEFSVSLVSFRSQSLFWIYNLTVGKIEKILQCLLDIFQKSFHIVSELPYCPAVLLRLGSANDIKSTRGHCHMLE